MLRRLAAPLAALVALAVLPAAASAGGLVATLDAGQASPLVGRAWHGHVTILGCSAFPEYGVDPEAPRLVFRHVRSGRTVRITLRQNRAVMRPVDYPHQQRYVATVKLPRAGVWRVNIVVTRHVRDAFGFDVRARRPATL